MKPLTIVVFGATGDLFRKKLTAVFFDLYSKNLLPEKFTFIGLSRKMLSHGEFREYTKKAIGLGFDEDLLEKFLKNFCYYSIDATDLDSLESLRGILDNIDKAFGECSNKLLYIATVPNLYESIFENIKKSGLSVACASPFGEEKSWIRILVEKPFGTDGTNALKLDQILSESFEEGQIFRIDHYLAKETLQNIFAFRFRNSMFEPLWSKNYIEKIEIRALETKDISGRENFYDKTGAIRDFGQNHLLEMLSLVAMEEPEEFTGESVQKSRGRLLSSVFFNFKNEADLILGQYEGYVNNLDESQTETYFKAKLLIESSRWEGVPFYIEHGKALSDSNSEIVVTFRPNESRKKNKVIFRISPNPEICTSLSLKNISLGGDKEEIQEVCFPLLSDESKSIYPYEKLLLDALSGDQTLFVSSAEVKEEWRITSEIQGAISKVKLRIYKEGTEPEKII